MRLPIALGCVLCISCGVVGTQMLLPTRAAAQSDSPRFARSGVALGLDLVSTSGWDWVTEASGAGPEMRGTIPGSAGLAASIAYAPVPWASASLSYAVSFYGESADSDVAAGASARLPAGRFMPYATVGVGRMTTNTAGGFTSDFVSVGAGSEVYVARRTAVDLRFERLVTVGEGTQNGNDAAASAEARNRWSIGARVHLGR
jgi:hypothetical protein